MVVEAGRLGHPAPPTTRRGSTTDFARLPRAFTVAGSRTRNGTREVIVLETIGESVEGFAKAAAQVPGLEWLAEMDLEDVEPADGFADAEKEDKKLPCRLYAVMSNQQAITRLLRALEEFVRQIPANGLSGTSANSRMYSYISRTFGGLGCKGSLG